VPFGIVGGDDSIIGGTEPGAGNLISGFYDPTNLLFGGISGVGITPGDRTVIEGNRIGTDVSGTYAIPNGMGVWGGGTGDVIGGSDPAARNIISGNARSGILFTGTQSAIQGNFIGTDVTGVRLLPNGWQGVDVAGSNNLIGGTTPGQANTIAFNHGAGILVLGDSLFGAPYPTGNRIAGNSIYSNGLLGIDLGDIPVDVNGIPTADPGAADHYIPGGLTLNDSLGHAGPNNFQNFPVLTAVSTSGGSTTVSGTFQEATEPNTQITIDFYANTAPDPSGYGEGQTYLGSKTVTTDAHGNASFTATGLAAIPAGQGFVTATATDAAGNTSEFSKCFAYNFSGFLSPISLNRAFKQGSTIPIKWTLTDVRGNPVTTLSAIRSLTVTIASTTYTLYNGTTNTSSYTSGGTVLRNDGGQYVFNWTTKGFATGSYVLTAALSDGSTWSKTIVLSTTGSTFSLVIDGATSSSITAGALLAGDLTVYIDNSNGQFTSDEQARILDAVAGIEALVSPYGANIYLVDASVGDDANIVLEMSPTSAVGGEADGVLGCTTDSGLVTLIDGWSWYAGADPAAVGAQQYDFQTVATHELGHVLGLGHSTGSTSVMYPNLGTGEIRRDMVAADLNVPDSDPGPSGLHAESTDMIKSAFVLADGVLLTMAESPASDSVAPIQETVSPAFVDMILLPDRQQLAPNGQLFGNSRQASFNGATAGGPRVLHIGRSTALERAIDAIASEWSWKDSAELGQLNRAAATEDPELFALGLAR
jgi:hypothetical protein